MKKITLFALTLVLMNVLLIQSCIADAKDASSSTTEISEGTENNTSNSDEVVSNTDSATLVKNGAVSEYEINLTKMAKAENQAPAPAKEQDSSKVKKINTIKAFVKSKNRKLSDAAATKVAEAALYANEKNQLDLSLILAVMWKESTFNANVYNANCYGIMQIHKNTAKGFGYSIADIKDPYKAADLGAKILKGHIKNYNNTVLGLTAYNAGSGNVKKGNYSTAYANNIIQKQKVIQAFLDSPVKNA